jgi:hypothetical protein
MTFYDDITDSGLALGVSLLVIVCTIIGVITSCYQYYRRQHRREREDSTVSLTSDF